MTIIITPDLRSNAAATIALTWAVRMDASGHTAPAHFWRNIARTFEGVIYSIPADALAAAISCAEFNMDHNADPVVQSEARILVMRLRMLLSAPVLTSPADTSELFNVRG